MYHIQEEQKCGINSKPQIHFKTNIIFLDESAIKLIGKLYCRLNEKNTYQLN